MKNRTHNRLADLELANRIDELYGLNAEEVAKLNPLAKVEHALLRKALSGDLAAIEFYLINKAPEEWRPVQKYTGQAMAYPVAAEPQQDISDEELRVELERRGLFPRVRQLGSKIVSRQGAM